MTPKELRAAADIALEQINFGFPVSDERIAALAEYILATVREDDDEPVTTEWISRLPETTTFNEILEIGPVTFGIEWTPPRLVFEDEEGDMSYLPVPKTRSQFRSLLAGLGIGLGEDDR